MRECRNCGVEKPLEEFPSRGGKQKHLKRYYCKACWKKRQATSRAQHKRGPNGWATRLASNLRRTGKNRTKQRDSDVTYTQLLRLGRPESCYLCGDSLAWEDAELDHVLPRTKGGKTTISNLRWAHRRCNRMKHDMTVEEFKQQMERILNHLG